MSSKNYYEERAGEFFEASLGVDMTPLRAKFLALLAPGGRILDAGCGSGRDARAFADAGHRVEAFDASPALVALARAHTGIDVRVSRFEQMESESLFDGIWACASLLHVAPEDLGDVFRRLERALVPGGVLYVSFKRGEGIAERDGRRFVDLLPSALEALVRSETRLDVLEIWETQDARPERANERWSNALLRRSSD